MFGRGECHAKQRAAAWGVLDRDGPAVCLGEPLDDA